MRIILDENGCLDSYVFDHGMCIEARVDASDLHSDDLHEVPTGWVSVTVRTPLLDTSVVEEAARDDFHENFAIKVLDDFDITPDTLDISALVRQALTAWCEQVHNIPVPVEFASDDVELGRLRVILSRIERNQVSTQDMPDYLESVMTVTNWASQL